MGDNIEFDLREASSVSEVGDLWRRLEHASDVSFFTSWTWIGTWLRCLPTEIQPRLLVASRVGEPIGAAILVPRVERRRMILKVRQMHFNSTGDPSLDCIAIEHNGFVAGARTQLELWPAFLRWFARQSEADELVIPGILDGVIDIPGNFRLLHSATTSPGFATSLMPGGLETVLSRLSRNSRQHLRRNIRSWERLGELRCEAANSVGTALQWFEALKSFHVASWIRRGKPHAFRHPFVETFHRALIERGVPNGSVQLLRMRAGSVPIGFLYNFRCGGIVVAYQSGFDYSRSEQRPGYVCHLLGMAADADAGAVRYDFLAGENLLKRSLGNERYTLRWHRFAIPKLALRIEAAVRTAWNTLRREKMALPANND